MVCMLGCVNHPVLPQQFHNAHYLPRLRQKVPSWAI